MATPVLVGGKPLCDVITTSHSYPDSVEDFTSEMWQRLLWPSHLRRARAIFDLAEKGDAEHFVVTFAGETGVEALRLRVADLPDALVDALADVAPTLLDLNAPMRSVDVEHGDAEPIEAVFERLEQALQMLAEVYADRAANDEMTMLVNGGDHAQAEAVRATLAPADELLAALTVLSGRGGLANSEAAYRQLENARKRARRF